MRVGSFSVLIPEGREHGSGHVGLSHGQVYTVRLGNRGSVRCDATLTIDGKHMGDYRVNAYGDWVLERAHDDPGRFTFFRASSHEAATAGVSEVANESRGLVEVRFRPEKQRPTATRGGGACGQSVGSWNEYSDSTRLCSTSDSVGSRGVEGPKGFAAGITGLTGHSSQQFHEVPNLDYDPSGEVVITLRLVEESNAVRPMRPVAKGNPVPAPIQ